MLTLGDNMQSDASPNGFATVYDSTWGRVKSITHPEAGNHDYGYSKASGYYGYFGSAAGDPTKGYYSFNLGAWHILAINSNCSEITGGCAVGGAEERWVRADLAANAGQLCTLAFFHHPRYSSGYEGDSTFMSPIFEDLYNANADVVLSGHSHDYERFAPSGQRLESRQWARDHAVRRRHRWGLLHRLQRDQAQQPGPTEHDVRSPQPHPAPDQLHVALRARGGKDLDRRWQPLLPLAGETTGLGHSRPDQGRFPAPGFEVRGSNIWTGACQTRLRSV